MQVARRTVMAVALLATMASCGTCGSASTSATTNLVDARVQGAWRLTVTTASYSGPPPPSTTHFPAGHKGTDSVWFQSTCKAPGNCTLQLWGASGPDPAQESFFRFYSNTTGLEGPPVSTPMTQSGAAYTQVFGTSGFGGFACPPSQTVPKPEQRLTLNVKSAMKGGTGWTATALTGTETQIAGWGCGSGGFTGWTVAHLTISGQPG